MSYQEVDHTADWALRVEGATLAELLTQAAAGMLELAGVEFGSDQGRQRTIKIESLDRESLLVDFLQELLLALELRGMAFLQIQIETNDENAMWGTVREAPVTHIDKPIKAVTYNELAVERDRRGYHTTVVFDV